MRYIPAIRAMMAIMAIGAVGCALDSVPGAPLQPPAETEACHGVDDDGPGCIDDEVRPPEWRAEVCNGIDDDLDGRIDNGMLGMRWHRVSETHRLAHDDSIAQTITDHRSLHPVDPGGGGPAAPMENTGTGEGLADGHGFTTTTSTYSGGNKLTSEIVSTDTDGATKRSSYANAYDSKGNWVKQSHSYYPDGVTPTSGYEGIYTYNSDGKRLTELMHHYSGPGLSLVTRQTITYTYDDNGNQVAYIMETDLGADGTVDQVWSKFQAYDSHGDLVEVTVQDTDGNVDMRTTYARSEDGAVLQEWTDLNGNGKVELHTIKTYDERGNLLRREYDTNEDGKVDMRRTMTYDESDNMLTDIREADATGHGVLNTTSVAVFTYNGAGEPLSYVSYGDSGGDGSFDWFSVETYDYNADGNPLTQVRKSDEDFDGTIDSTFSEKHTYSPDGNLLSTVSEGDFLGNGVQSARIKTYSFECPGG
jgi:hypothetical protein